MTYPIVTLTGEYHMSETKLVRWHPISLDGCQDVVSEKSDQTNADVADGFDWWGTVAYAERHAAPTA